MAASAHLSKRDQGIPIYAGQSVAGISLSPYPLADNGLVVLDLLGDPAFAGRRLHVRDVAQQAEGMQRLARAFLESPDEILQALVNAAVELCDADSAGISVEREDKTDANYYQWVATAGKYAPFVNATLPRYPSAFGIGCEAFGPACGSRDWRWAILCRRDDGCQIDPSFAWPRLR